MFKNIPVIAFLSTILLLISCSTNDSNTMSISGSIDYVGDATIKVATIPLHYKYSPVQEFIVTPNKEGAFDVSVPILPDDQHLLFSIDDESFLLIVDGDDNLNLSISRSSFPLDVGITSKNLSDYKSYQEYLKETDGMDKKIEKEMNNYKDGLDNTAIEMNQEKISIAEEYLYGTAYENLIAKAKGELLVNRIKSIEYRLDQNGFDASSEREKTLQQAKTDGFFTLESLESQRAGIRDVTHYYARTFGIYDSVTQTYGKELAEYDIKRLAYEELNRKRLEVLDQIESKKALAYAKLFLVAERIGELELKVAEPSYTEYISNYSEFNEYTEFLTYFYNEIKSVSPGEPAVPFSLVDQNGKTHTLEEYKGKYVLLDFWAGWCQPCLDEFPAMREIYNDFSRKNFEILGISTEVDKSIWEIDISRFENPWPQLYGGNGFDQETFRAYKGGGIPFYILIGPDGNIVRYNDIRATFNLREVLNDLINE